MRGFWLALGFLSRLPSRNVAFSPDALARALFWFPAVGALLGAVWCAAAYCLTPWLAPPLRAFLLLALGVIFSGALHLDGVADSFDGFSAAGGGRDKALAAMKDSRIGAHGAVALLLVLLGKLVAFNASPALALVYLTAAIAARWVAAMAIAHAKPARDTGLGAVFATGGAKARLAAWSGAFWFLIPLVVSGAELRNGFVAVGSLTAACFCAAWLVRRSLRAFGGVTGDTHGALIELSETAALLAGVALGEST